MAERDRAAVDVDAVEVDARAPAAEASTTPANASLISHSVNVLRAHPVGVEQLARRLGGAQVQRRVRPGDDRAADDVGERVARAVGGGDDRGGGAVGDLRGVAGGDRAVAGEGGRQLRQGLERRRRAHALVALELRQRRDLLGEPVRAAAAALRASAPRARPAPRARCPGARSRRRTSRPCRRRRSSSTGRRGPSRRSSARRPSARRARAQRVRRTGHRVEAADEHGASPRPPRIIAAAMPTALMLARQTSLSVMPGTVRATPPCSAARRPGFCPLAACRTFPTAT